MVERSFRLPLRRRLMAHCLLLGLGSVAAFALGMAWLGGRLDVESHSALPHKLGLAAQRIAQDYAEHAGDQVSLQLERTRTELGLAYCAVISDVGQILAHTSPTRVGQQAAPASEWLVQVGGIEQTRQLNADAPGLCRYRIPLLHGERRFGLLEAAVLEHGGPAWDRVFGRRAPAVLLGPLLVLSLGSVLLARTSYSLSSIEEQLVRVAAEPSKSGQALEPIAEREPVASGWNRLVEQSISQALSGKLEDRLRNAVCGLKQRQAERVLLALPDGIAATDGDGTLMLTNAAFRALLGVSEEHLEGRRIEEVLPLDSAPDGEELRRKIAETSRPLVVELGRSDSPEGGTLRLARWPLDTSEAGTLGHVWSLRDITQQKLSEEMRNQFVYSATHELRTPLANIKAYAETLALNEVTDVERQKEFCNTINSEATRLARFVDELLNISRMEAGSLSLDRQETDFARLVTEVVEKVRPQMNQKKLDFQMRIPPKLPKLTLDKDKFTAALVNLFGNAAKYTPEGGRVTLQVDVGAEHLQIHVEDTGIGIAGEELPKIFNKFFRSEDARVRDVSGTGLGLSFANEVVRLHGGKLGVHSEKDKGSKFTIQLPLH